jgi:hypothetical protein
MCHDEKPINNHVATMSARDLATGMNERPVDD